MRTNFQELYGVCPVIGFNVKMAWHINRVKVEMASSYGMEVKYIK
jgi:hypothetical protein